MTTLSLPRAIGWRRWRQALRRPSMLVALAMLAALAIVWSVAFVVAAQPKSLDQRTYEVASQLRCPACNGETVAEASTPIAQEMRAVIRQKLQAGESEQQVLADFRASYGDAILAAPPTTGFSVFIWLGPWLMLLLGLVVVVGAAREWRAAKPTTADESEDELAVEALGVGERTRLLDVLRREVAADEGLPFQHEEGR
jgi:cytochrome c-type biogenesis protein CcmH